MKLNQVNSIFATDAKRRNNIISRLVLIVIIFIVSLSLLIIYLNGNKVKYVKYDEKSDILYNVILKENEFYKDNSLEEKNQYISALIDYINAEFKYNLSLEERDVEYKYSYRVEANVVVRDKNTKRNIYEYDDLLIQNMEVTTRDKNVLIDEKLDIDYNKYNNLISRFVQTYNLSETENFLYVNLYVNVIGSCEDFVKDSVNESVTSLVIPLTSKTIAIDITNNLVNKNDNVMVCSRPSSMNIIFLIISLLILIADIILIVDLINYVRNSRSAKTLYDIELRKILNNYRSYIQKVNSKFELKGYQLLKVDNFTDMLEIRDTTNQPILMVENGLRNGVYFIIPTSTKILYLYSIKVSDIEKELKLKDR